MTRRPGGHPPPAAAAVGEATYDLAALAGAAADRHLAEHPADVERYGAALAREWAVHDGQHLLSWAAQDVNGHFALQERVDWLAGVLHARGYPLAHLGRYLQLLADEAGEPLAAPLRAVQVRAAG